jgi:uncharacterized protein YecE (DUF72 family)
VEVNSSFYRPPNPGHVENWVRRTPRDFRFTVKLWQKFTHPRMYQTATGEVAAIAQSDVDLFKSSIEPLYQTGKLGALLAQFPPSFQNDHYSQQMLSAVIRTFGQYCLAVELRHRSWSDDAHTAALLREHNVTWVQIDEPKFPSSIAADVPLTADIAYFRFHGRNEKDWWSGDNETRYRYLYSPEELRELEDKMRPALEQASLVFAFFNNHWRGNAARNAADMKKGLKLPIHELPLPGKLLDKE